MAVSRRLLAQAFVAGLLEQPTRRRHWVRAAAAYLLDNGMTNQVELFMNDVAHELFIQNGQLTTEVVSARQLTDKVLADLQRYLRSVTGAKTIDAQVSHDAALLGGFVARTADGEINKSVQHQLNQLRSIA